MDKETFEQVDPLVDEVADQVSALIDGVDCHWETDALYEACSRHQSWVPALGFGYQQHKATYHAPRKRGDAAPILGDAWHVV
ncbi:MAG: hypothetical protein GY903_00615, partial [Fuerstiella sp.]|nr:hypothetical protein [Fuerstiella sp.]